MQAYGKVVGGDVACTDKVATDDEELVCSGEGRDDVAARRRVDTTAKGVPVGAIPSGNIVDEDYHAQFSTNEEEDRKKKNIPVPAYSKVPATTT